LNTTKHQKGFISILCVLFYSDSDNQLEELNMYGHKVFCAFLPLAFDQYNKHLTRDNLAKRQEVADKSCLFCKDCESSHHLFFECVVAKRIWSYISDTLNRDLGGNFDSVGMCWLSDEKFAAINIVSAAILWGIWKLRNELYFQNAVWLNVKQLLWRIAGLAQNWLILCPAKKKEELKSYILKLHSWARRPEMLPG
jgi:hypothetical protein